MKWTNEEGYIDYKQSLHYLKDSLGINYLNFVLREELAPYMTRIIQYLSKKLVTLGEDASILDKLNLIFNTFDYGADLIVNLDGIDLAEEVGVLDVSEDDEVKYEQDRFIFSWSNLMTSLVELLKLQYASLLHEPVKQGCPCICGNGETWKDFESYTSGVWPEDEEYQTYDLTKTVNTTAFTSLSGCGCGGQRMKSNYDS